MTGFPKHPRELTESWLSDAFRSAGVLDTNGAVTSFVSTSIGEGVSMVCQVVRVDIAYAESGGSGPNSVVMKFVHDNDANRSVGLGLRLYEREAAFYNDVVCDVAVSMPVCYFAAFDSAVGASLIVLEDLADCSSVDQVKGASPSDVCQIMDALAPLHAAYWGGVNRSFPIAAAKVDGDWCEDYSRIVDGTWENCLVQFGSFIPKKVVAALPRYVSSFRQLHRAMGKGRLTLVHGDPRLDNVMFRRKREMVGAVLLDWQTLMITNPVHDLALLLSMSVSSTVRRKHEVALVRHYHTRLLEHGVVDYDFDACLADYNVALLYVMSVALVIGGAYDPANQRGKRLAESVLRRACTAVLDRNLLQLIPTEGK